jgi:hypothetical protein
MAWYFLSTQAWNMLAGDATRGDLASVNQNKGSELASHRTDPIQAAVNLPDGSSKDVHVHL